MSWHTCVHYPLDSWLHHGATYTESRHIHSCLQPIDQFIDMPNSIISNLILIFDLITLLCTILLLFVLVCKNTQNWKSYLHFGIMSLFLLDTHFPPDSRGGLYYFSSLSLSVINTRLRYGEIQHLRKVVKMGDFACEVTLPLLPLIHHPSSRTSRQ